MHQQQQEAASASLTGCEFRLNIGNIDNTPTKPYEVGQAPPRIHDFSELAHLSRIVDFSEHRLQSPPMAPCNALERAKSKFKEMGSEALAAAFWVDSQVGVQPASTVREVFEHSTPIESSLSWTVEVFPGDQKMELGVGVIVPKQAFPDGRCLSFAFDGKRW